MWYQWKYNIVAVFFFKSNCKAFTFDVKEIPDGEDFPTSFSSTGCVANIFARTTGMDVVAFLQHINLYWNFR